MKHLIFVLVLLMAAPAVAETYTDGRGNVVTPDPQTQRAINEAKALRGKYYADRYYGGDGVTIRRDGTVYHFNGNGVTTRGDLDYRRGASDDLKAACGDLRPRKQERCIRDYNEEQQKLRQKYRN